ncbi:MAG: phosphoesterase PA-phosphatase related [Chlorobi bacterium]|nr:phosphoesterase PA-phosphatase related [Chlorobiota bacterium]
MPAATQPDRIGLRAIASILLLLLLCASHLRAATDPPSPPPPSPSIGDTIVSDIAESGSDAALFFAAPARFGARSWGIAGGIMGGTGLMMLADDPVRRGFSGAHNATKDRIADIGNLNGTILPAGVISGGLYLSGLLFDSPSLRLAGRHIVESVTFAAAITTTVKALVGRQRPFLNGGPYVFHGPSLNDDLNSLPSGHTTVAFALCSSLAADIDRPWATVGLYSIAAVTGLSRIYVDRHWASDVFLGAAIGTICGYGVSHLHDGPGGATGLLIVPTTSGFAMCYTF